MALFGDRIFTPRLCLRKIEETDVEKVVAWSHSPQACGSYLSPEEFETGQLRTQLRTKGLWQDTERLFLIERRDTGEPIGTIHYWTLVAGSATVALALKIAVPEMRGQGFGTEAQKYLIMHLFDREGREAVEMYTDIDNIPQQRCLGKLGFELVDTTTYMDQQTRRTGHLYRLVRAVYQSHPIYQYHES